MTEQTGPTARVLEETKHTRTLRVADGSVVAITRGDVLHALTIHPGREVPTVLHLSGHDLRALASEPGPDTCGNCKFGRYDLHQSLRCHRNPPRKRGDEAIFIRVNATEWCAKHRRLVPSPAVAS